jgi:hypothetical protein
MCTNMVAQALSWQTSSRTNVAAAAAPAAAASPEAKQLMQLLCKLEAAGLEAEYVLGAAFQCGDSWRCDVLGHCIASALTRAVSDTQGRDLLQHMRTAFCADSAAQDALWDYAAMHGCLLAIAASPAGMATRNALLAADLKAQLQLMRRLQECIRRCQASEQPQVPRNCSSQHPDAAMQHVGTSSRQQAAAARTKRQRRERALHFYCKPSGNAAGTWVQATHDNCFCQQGVLLMLAWWVTLGEYALWLSCELQEAACLQCCLLDCDSLKRVQDECQPNRDTSQL